jgi:hypothetical protein
MPESQGKQLPVLHGRPGRVHTDDAVNDILDTMLRDGKAPYGKPRQHYNYRFHPRLKERKADLESRGETIHETFKHRKFWKEWQSKQG